MKISTVALLITCMLFSMLPVLGQKKERLDSLKKVLATAPADSNKVLTQLEVVFEYQTAHPDSGLLFAREALTLSQKLNFAKGESRAWGRLSYCEHELTNWVNAFEYAKKALEVAKKSNLPFEEASAYERLAGMEGSLGFTKEALNYFKMAEDGYKKAGDQQALSVLFVNIGGLYSGMAFLDKTGKKDSLNRLAREFLTKGLEIRREIRRTTNPKLTIVTTLTNLASIYEELGEDSIALKMVDEAEVYAKENGNLRGLFTQKILRAKLKFKQGDLLAAEQYATAALVDEKNIYTKPINIELYKILSDIYEKKGDFKKAYEFLLIEDDLFKEGFDNSDELAAAESLRESLQADKEANEKRVQQLYIMLYAGGLFLVLLLLALVYRNNVRQKQSYRQLEEKNKQIVLQGQKLQQANEEIIEQKNDLQKSYENIELLNEIGKKITSNLSVESTIKTVYTNVNELMDAGVLMIGMYSKEKQNLEMVAMEKNILLPPFAYHLSEKNRPAVWCFENKQEVIINDFQQEYHKYFPSHELPEAKSGENVHALVYLPLYAKNEIIGALSVQSFQKNAYSEYHINILRNLAIYTSIALENASSFRKIEQQNQEITSQREEITKTFNDLKATQSQLIQSEKMASLGELTAGIAHEIQNPLNFVNNFSEVNTELIDELEQEINNGDIEAAKALAKDIRENEQKINHHGKRADAIVKGMLQHSRSSSGTKEPTNINALADEYLRLAYHGLRAKDKSFNATMKTDFDESIGPINIIPQDIGRVILNLITNAFYAVNDKKKTSPATYQPTVDVSTKKHTDKVEIRVADNGNGIPKSVIEKIFQPFFTTKPTGEGTGLGLSMSYDIITKGHGGELLAETTPGEGSVFIINIPI